jgi:hypothetical protein
VEWAACLDAREVADVGVSLYELAALVAVAVIGRSQWRNPPVLIGAFMVIVLAGAGIQAVVMLAYRLVVRPRVTRGTVCQVTDYRVLVTAGLRSRRTWSAYLDQISESALCRRRDGSLDLVLRAEAGPVTRRLLAGFPVVGRFLAGQQ